VHPVGSYCMDISGTFP